MAELSPTYFGKPRNCESIPGAPFSTWSLWYRRCDDIANSMVRGTRGQGYASIRAVLQQRPQNERIVGEFGKAKYKDEVVTLEAGAKYQSIVAFRSLQKSSCWRGNEQARRNPPHRVLESQRKTWPVDMPGSLLLVRHRHPGGIPQ